MPSSLIGSIKTNSNHPYTKIYGRISILFSSIYRIPYFTHLYTQIVPGFNKPNINQRPSISSYLGKRLKIWKQITKGSRAIGAASRQSWPCQLVFLQPRMAESSLLVLLVSSGGLWLKLALMLANPPMFWSGQALLTHLRLTSSKASKTEAL